MVTGGNDGNVVVFNRATSKIAASLVGHSSRVNSVIIIFTLSQTFCFAFFKKPLDDRLHLRMMALLFQVRLYIYIYIQNENIQSFIF